MRSLLILFLCLGIHHIFSQKMYYQDIFKGGVCVVGVSTQDAGDSVYLPLHFSNAATIKKAFLCYYYVNCKKEFPKSPFIFGLNSNPISLDYFTDRLSLVSNLINPIGNSSNYNGHISYLKDVSNYISTTMDSVLVDWTNYQTPPPDVAGCPSSIFGGPMLICLYDDPSLDEINVSLLINEQANQSNITIPLEQFNPVNTNNNIGFGIQSDRLSAAITDGYNFLLNTQSIGNVNLPDIITIGATGVMGNYFYENGTMTGLTDDLADSLFAGSDGIVILNSYGISSLNNNVLHVNYMSSPTHSHNFLIGLNFAYTSTCASFPVTTTPDTSVCKGTLLQLHATGGVQYKWEPAAGLSCSTCANPVVQTDSSQLYTVRIWNNDSCSVVRPVHISVYQPAKFSGIAITPATCGEADGQITATLSNTAYLPLSFSINNAPFQFSSTYTKQFQNLPFGPLLLTAKDGHQCTIDTLLTIPYNNTSVAQFTATPSTGATPLNVQFVNQSTNATNYAWEINATSLGSFLNSHIFDTAGTYFVQLYAWQNVPECIDSFSVQIIVFDSLVVQVPNVFTVNNDGVNDVFSLNSNQEISVAYSIVNRWGTVVASGTSKSLPITNSAYTTTIWDGQNATNGVYFYTITLQSQGENKIVKGFVERLE